MAEFEVMQIRSGTLVRKLGYFNLIIFCWIGLTACEEKTQSDRIAQMIQQDVIQRGGISLKLVSCPEKIQPKAGEKFECVGELNSGQTFTIPVQQTDDKGKLVWEIPHAKGLLNMPKFETLIQDSLQIEFGSETIVRCGKTIYKAVQAGDRFECHIEVKPKDRQNSKNKPAKPGSVLVRIDREQNVSWQRLLAE
jgi:hypothetical protein